MRILVLRRLGISKKGLIVCKLLLVLKTDWLIIESCDHLLRGLLSIRLLHGRTNEMANLFSAEEIASALPNEL
jgi:hypothetical protein